MIQLISLFIRRYVRQNDVLQQPFNQFQLSRQSRFVFAENTALFLRTFNQSKHCSKIYLPTAAPEGEIPLGYRPHQLAVRKNRHQYLHARCHPRRKTGTARGRNDFGVPIFGILSTEKNDIYTGLKKCYVQGLNDYKNKNIIIKRGATCVSHTPFYYAC